MKLEHLEENEVRTIGDSADIEFGIDKEDEWIIFRSFINYSDPISSLVREITSNAYDAHIEAGISDPVIVKITEEDVWNGIPAAFSVIDKGTGLSPHVIKTVYSKFGKSTKRHRDDIIGGYGFGAKSPLSYQDMFELITVSDGIKYYYSIHKGERSPIITLLSEDEVDEPNGTEVRVLIKEGDEEYFREAIRTSLMYFDNINYVNCGIDNNYQIIKGKHFIYRTGIEEDTLHICIGKVRYELKGKNYFTPVGLYFDIGEIPVVWNREDVEYTDKAKAAIEEKIKLAREELQELYDEGYANINSIEDFVRTDSSSNIVINRDGDEYTIPVKTRSYGAGLISAERFYPKFKKLRVKNNAQIYIPVRFLLARGNYISYTHSILGKTVFLIPKGHSRSSVLDKYILETYGNVNILNIIPRKAAILDMLRMWLPGGIDFVRKPYSYPKEERQAIMQEVCDLYDETMDFIKNNTEVYTKDIIPDKWYEEYQKELERKRKEREEVFIYRHVQTDSHFITDRVSGNSLKRAFGNNTVIYGFQKDREYLIKIKRMIQSLFNQGRNFIEVIQISMRNEKVIREVLPDTSYYIEEVDKIPAIKRAGKKYNLMGWHKELIELGLYENIRLKNPYAVWSYDKYSVPTIPDYIILENPSPEEKYMFYENIGKQLQYPLLKFVNGHAKEELIKEYKEMCPYHNINPILIGKLHVKKYENKRNSKQSESNSDSGS